MEDKPLVSIVVITYNSSLYVEETLDSVISQTYPYYEIIVSDDCSTDNTIEICQQWIQTHSEFGKRIELIQAKENTGVAGNCNRGIAATKGAWVKFVAGDDILLPNCLEDNIEYARNNSDSKIIFSDYLLFNNSGGQRKVWKSNRKSQIKEFFELNAKEQHKRLLKKNVLPGPTSFLDGEIIRKYGFNEKYKFMEDTPLWIKLTGNGYRIYFMNKETMMYRQHESLSKSSKRFFSPLFYSSNVLFFWNERVNFIREYNLNDAYQYNRKAFFMCDVADLLFNNRRNAFTNVLYKTIYWFVKHCMNFKF